MQYVLTKEAVAYLLFFFVISVLDLRSSGRLLVFLWFLTPFFANLFLYFYERKWMSEVKKDERVTTGKF